MQWNFLNEPEFSKYASSFLVLWYFLFNFPLKISRNVKNTYSYTGYHDKDMDCGPLLCIIDNGPGYKMRTKITIIRL